VPSYDLQIHTTAKGELADLPSSKRDRLADTLQAVAREREPTSHEAVRALQGQPDTFRVRVGSVRAVCRLVKPSLRVLLVGDRKNVYDGIDETIAERTLRA